MGNKAKILLGEDVQLDEKALKQAEELERVAKRLKRSILQRLEQHPLWIDNLQELKALVHSSKKLNALGIFKFEQIAK